jgi:hypothetical protein
MSAGWSPIPTPRQNCPKPFPVRQLRRIRDFVKGTIIQREPDYDRAMKRSSGRHTQAGAWIPQDNMDGAARTIKGVSGFLIFGSPEHILRIVYIEWVKRKPFIIAGWKNTLKVSFVSE